MRRGKKTHSGQKNRVDVNAVDLFCGAGGLTRGLESAGIQVRLGVDIDPACEFPYTANNKAKFLLQSVGQLSAEDLLPAFDQAPFRLLAGCAPCQPFSTYNQKADSSDGRWWLLLHFSRLIRDIRPELVTMENVPRLAEQTIFREFIHDLETAGYQVVYSTVSCSDYGVPQQRRRLVLLASSLGPIRLMTPGECGASTVTVRKAIGRMPSLNAGQVDAGDLLHQAAALSQTNLRRIQASRPGGTWRDWAGDLRADCHSKRSGKTYPSVYGRMCWDEPAPTITTEYFGFGSGRFGHPEQDRAISLREGAILQSFPRGYKFVRPGDPIYKKLVGRLVGNAVPVKLGEVIGRSIVAHVAGHTAASDAAPPNSEPAR